MDLKITPKPADEVIAKEGSYKSNNEETLSLQESLALEMNKNSTQLDDLNKMIDQNTSNPKNMDTMNTLDSTKTINPVSESVNLKNTNNDVKTLNINNIPHHNTKPNLIDNDRNIHMSEEQAQFIEKNNSIKVGSPIIPKNTLLHQNMINNDNADLLRTNIYYSKKLYEEVKLLRKSIRFQGLVKYFFTAMIVLSSIASLFFGYRLFTEMFANGDTSNLMSNFGQGFIKQIGANLFNNQTHNLNTNNINSNISNELGKYDKYLDVIKDYLSK